jgi:hypothetical protein
MEPVQRERVDGRGGESTQPGEGVVELRRPVREAQAGQVERKRAKAALREQRYDLAV